MFPFIIAGTLFAIAVYFLGWSNGFAAGETYITDEIEVIIPEIIPPRSMPNYPVRHRAPLKCLNYKIN